MTNPTAKQMLTQSLKDGGYGGLYCEECSCGIENLCNMCYELNSAMSEDCRAGYKVPCNCDLNKCGVKCEYHIVADKQEPECDKCSDGLVYSHSFYNQKVFVRCSCPAGQRLKEEG